MNKKPEVTEQTKTNLKEAFFELYTQKPIEKITIHQITDRAGYNRGTFYLYYNDVYDILREIEDMLLHEIDILIHEKLLNQLPLDILKCIGMIVDIHQSYSKYVIVLLSDNGDPAFETKLKELLKPFWTEYFLSDETRTELETELLLEYHLSGLLALISKWLSYSDQMDVEEFMIFAVNHILGGSGLFRLTT